MHFVAFLESAQNRNGIFSRRLAHHHRLESTLKRRILLDVLAILVERGRANGVQFAPRKLRLEQIRRIHRALTRTGSDDRVQLVDKQNDSPFGLGHFLEEGLQAILKLTAVLRPRKHATKVHRNDALVFHRVRHIAGNNPPRETLNNRRLAYARLTNQHRIVLGPAR